MLKLRIFAKSGHTVSFFVYLIRRQASRVLRFINQLFVHFSRKHAFEVKATFRLPPFPNEKYISYPPKRTRLRQHRSREHAKRKSHLCKSDCVRFLNLTLVTKCNLPKPKPFKLAKIFWLKFSNRK